MLRPVAPRPSKDPRRWRDPKFACPSAHKNKSPASCTGVAALRPARRPRGVGVTPEAGGRLLGPAACVCKAPFRMPHIAPWILLSFARPHHAYMPTYHLEPSSDDPIINKLPDTTLVVSSSHQAHGNVPKTKSNVPKTKKDLTGALAPRLRRLRTVPPTQTCMGGGGAEWPLSKRRPSRKRWAVGRKCCKQASWVWAQRALLCRMQIVDERLRAVGFIGGLSEVPITDR